MNRLKTGLGALAFAATVALAGQASAATTVSSTFDTDADGWAFGAWQSVGGTPQPVTYDASAGRISKIHGFGGWGFIAPLKFLGEKSEFIGGTLEFDLSSVLTDYEDRPLVALTGNNGKTIFSRWGDTPGPQLQTFSLGLAASSFYVGSPTGVSGAVTTAAFDAIMGDLEQIQIFGDWGPNVDNVQLDNVVMGGATGAVPEPATWAMMILGFGAAGTMMRRRRAALAAV
jgi:hypothetical protein